MTIYNYDAGSCMEEGHRQQLTGFILDHRIDPSDVPISGSIVIENGKVTVPVFQRDDDLGVVSGVVAEVTVDQASDWPFS